MLHIYALLPKVKNFSFIYNGFYSDSYRAAVPCRKKKQEEGDGRFTELDVCNYKPFYV